jgi:branched-chain amino acid transport system permease protein
VLTLMIIATAVHFAMTGLALYFFGPEGLRAPAFSEASVNLTGLPLPVQSLVMIGVSAAVIVALWLVLEHTLTGKALRATAVNPTGARLLGIRAVRTGKLAFALAAGIGALSGVLIVPVTTLYYDSGLIIGLKGFVGAVFGALVTLPAAGAGALLVGLIDSFAAFWASAFKESILFLMILPVLVWLSIRSGHALDEAEDH